MNTFMNEDFLLHNNTAKKLYHDCAEFLPIIDYHCHINPAEIAEDHHFKNITEAWLKEDHYKWRYMRSCGIDEAYITGSADPKEKFIKWAEVLGKAIGNPLYAWSHLELQRYFDFDKPLNRKTAEEAWEVCNQQLSTPSMSARGIIFNSNVKVICTTDDPIDTLEYHKVIAKDLTFPTKVLPSFRPDKAMNIESNDYLTYLENLSDITHIDIESFTDLTDALHKRMDFFERRGCCISDHGLMAIMYAPASDIIVDGIFKKRMDGKDLSEEEIAQFKTAFLMFVCKEYVKRDWVMQLHYGCRRNNSTKSFNVLGPDTGFDCILYDNAGSQLAALLDALETANCLPRTILYSLNPNDNQAIMSLIGCFQDSSHIGKLQQGASWWFNDTQQGIIDHIVSTAALGNLSGFVGMLTDSRSFLSYTRHEYFRRILCNQIGTWVENGEFSNDRSILREIVSDISYYNAASYFSFK